MTIVLTVCMGILILSGALALVRVITPGTSVADRVIALDLLLLFVVMGIAVFSVGRDTGAFLDVLIVVSLLGFVGTVTVARFIERRGSDVLNVVVDVVVAVLLLAGCLLALLAAVGLHRFPDLMCRMHAATKPATLGLVFIALAVGVTVTTQGSIVKLLLVVILQFLTTPVAAHMVGRAAYRSGVPLSDLTMLDELGRDDADHNRYGATS